MLKWEKGRLLTGYGAASYVYDINGIRQEKKTASEITHNYYTEGNIIHKETRGGNELWYYYDATGITGMEYNGTVYFFLKNIQGDVTRIVDATGKLVARYIYDAWGCHKVYNASGVVTTDTAHIGNINPFRYRGYYYDAETGLYYLNSRYYDPEAGRFINADDISYLDPTEINGCNLYVYSLNNPIMYSDPSGHFPILIALILGGTALIGGIVGGKISYDNAVSAGKTGFDLFWSTVSGAVLGAGVGLVIGGTIVFTAGMAAGIAGGLGASVLGVTAHQAFAWGVLAWNVTAWVIMPLYGITMQGISYEPDPYQPPKPGKTPKHPADGKSMLLPNSFSRKKNNWLNYYLMNKIGLRSFY